MRTRTVQELSEKHKAVSIHKRLTGYRVSKATEEFIVSVSKSMDGRTFTLLIKYLNELRNDVLDNPHHKITPDSFLIFLDKIKNISHSANMNEVIMKKIVNVNLDELKAKRMLNLYQQHSFDFKFEENLRLGEIRQFAQEVIPKPRFLFDSYKTSESQIDTNLTELASSTDINTGSELLAVSD